MELWKKFSKRQHNMYAYDAFKVVYLLDLL